MKNLIAFISSFIFGMGLEISQMTNPQKVQGFLNIFGEWDPSLAFVMVSAIGINGILYFLFYIELICSASYLRTHEASLEPSFFRKMCLFIYIDYTDFGHYLLH